jgi:hypothetical protein
MLDQVRRLAKSLLLDVTDASIKAALVALDSSPGTPSSDLIDSMLGHCEALQLGYAPQSTVHLRARLLANLLTHERLEEELTALIHKSEVSPEDIARIDEIARVVDRLSIS